MLSRLLKRHFGEEPRTLVLVALSCQLRRLMMTKEVTRTLEIGRQVPLFGVTSVLWFVLTSNV